MNPITKIYFIILILLSINKIESQSKMSVVMEKQLRVGQSFSLVEFDLDNLTNSIRTRSLVYYDGNAKTGAFDSNNSSDYYYTFNENNNSYLRKLKEDSNSFTEIGMFNSNIIFRGLEFDPTSGILYGMTTKSLYLIDHETASATLIGETGINANSIAIDGEGKFYSYDITNGNFYLINKNNGEANLIGYLGFNNIYIEGGMAWDSLTDKIYMTYRKNINDSENTEIRSINKATGNSSKIGIIDGGNGSFQNYCYSISFKNNKLLNTDNYNKMEFEFYPNPTKNKINFKSSSPIKSVIIYDLIGNIVFKIKENSIDSIDLTELNSGLYIMKVLLNRNYRTLKIMKN